MISDIPTADDGNNNDNRRIAAISEILSSERRVAVIDALDSGGEVSMSQVIDHVVSRNTQSGRDEDSMRKSITIALYQTHLPKLEAAGIVRYEWGASEINRGPQYRLVRDALAGVRQNSS